MADQELVLRIRADLRDVQTKLRQLERDGADTANDMARRFQDAGRRISGAFRAIRGPALAATAAATGFAILAQRSLEAVEAIQDLADRADVSAEFLQEMRFATEQSGASARDFDDAISRLNRRLGLYIQNLTTGEGEAGPAAAAFRALGLETRIASGELADSESVFRAAVESLQDVESQAQRSALASQLFGEDSGPRLVALLNRGVGGLEDLAQAARDAGIVLENDLVANAGAASDAIEVMQRQIGAEFNRAIAENTAGLIAFAEAFSRIVVAAVQAAAAVGDFVRWTTTALGVQGNFELISEQDVQDQRARVGELLQIYTDRFQSDTGSVQLATLRQVLPTEDIERLEQAGRNGATATERLGMAVQFLAERYRELGIRLREVRAAADDTPLDSGGAGEAAIRAARIYGGLASEAAASADALEGLGAQIKATFYEGESSMDGVIERVDLMKDAFEDVTDGAVKELEDAFVDFVRTGRIEISNFVDYIIEQFARLAFQEWFEGPLNSLLSAGISAIGGSIGLGSGGGGNIKAAGGQVRTAQAPVTNVFIDARYATEGTAEMIENAFRRNGPIIVRESVNASVSTVSSMQYAASAT